MIYQYHLIDGIEKGWSKTYIHLSHQHQQFIEHLPIKSGWYLQTYFHVLHHHP